MNDTLTEPMPVIRTLVPEDQRMSHTALLFSVHFPLLIEPVVYGVTDKKQFDPKSRVNTFAHVNHEATDPRLGVLLCINGTSIFIAWLK